MANDEHVEVVLAGADAIEEWRAANPDGRFNLRDANLRGAKLNGAKLSGADLRHAHLLFADLSGASLSDASLVDAGLDWANLAGANLTNADLRNATLFRTDLRGADLDDTQLGGAHLAEAHLDDATFYPAERTLLRGRVLDPGQVWLDECSVQRTRFLPRGRDPWSVLRRTYTGPRFILTLIFLLAFIAPRIGKAMFWKGVQAGEERVRSTVEQLSESVDSMSNPQRREALQRLIKPLEKYGEFSDTRWKKHSVGGLVLDSNKGALWLGLTLALFVFNLARALVMWFVAPMRDAEERSSVTPAKDDYRKWYYVHRFVVAPLFWVSLGVFLWRIGGLLFLPVYLPA